MEISYPIDVDEPIEDTVEARGDWQFRPLPIIEPGQIWLAETAATSLSPLHRHAIGRANVVLYERALAPLVARSLPLGTYAEPLPPDVATGSAIAPRAVQFAADGWSVVQLVAARGDRRGQPRASAAALSALSATGDLPVLAIADARGSRRREGCLRNLAGLVNELGSGELLTLIFGPLVVRYPAQRHAFTANGLAG